MNKEICIKELSGMIRDGSEKLMEEYSEGLERKIEALKYAKGKVMESEG